MYTCKYCGEQFDVLWKYSTHCAKTHSTKLREYQVHQKENNVSKYMDNPILCKQCNKPIPYGRNVKQRKFCSKSCAASWNNDHIFRKWAGGRKKVTCRKARLCPSCGAIKIKGKSKFCSVQCWIIDNNKREIKKWLRATKSPPWSFCNRPVIRRHILETQGDKCAICRMPPIWNGKPLLFLMDHIDGNTLNNFKDNLRLICSNCDSQLDTYKKRKDAKYVSKNKIKMLEYTNEIIKNLSDDKKSKQQ